MRQRSAQLFTENLYARGLIRRLVTNEINTGLTPEALPDEKIIGVPEDSLGDWTEDVENRFHLWGRSPRQCDWKHASTFGELQRKARTEALVSVGVGYRGLVAAYRSACDRKRAGLVLRFLDCHCNNRINDRFALRRIPIAVDFFKALKH